MRGPACVSPAPWRRTLVRKDNVDAFSIAQVIRLPRSPRRNPEGWPGCCRQSSPHYRGKFPVRHQICTINEDLSGSTTAQMARNCRFHHLGGNDSPAMHKAVPALNDKRPGKPGRLVLLHCSWHCRGRPRGPPAAENQRLPISGTSRLAAPLNSWRGRPILYSGSVIISSHCEIQPGVRASAKMQVNSEVGMPSARCTMPE